MYLFLRSLPSRCVHGTELSVDGLGLQSSVVNVINQYARLGSDKAEVGVL